ncbi:hypothetical protein D3C78_1455480 [compost metagenome]
MCSTRITSSIGVPPSISHELSSRATICSSWPWPTRSPISVVITSLSVMIPTTNAYSLRITAKSSPAVLKLSSASDSVRVSGTISAERICTPLLSTRL